MESMRSCLWKQGQYIHNDHRDSQAYWLMILIRAADKRLVHRLTPPPQSLRAPRLSTWPLSTGPYSAPCSSFPLSCCRKWLGPSLSNFSRKENSGTWGLKPSSPGAGPCQGFKEAVLSEVEWGEQDGYRAEQGYGLRWGPASSWPPGEPCTTMTSQR